eukprot:3799019-Rhodomonas_salina.1
MFRGAAYQACNTLLVAGYALPQDASSLRTLDRSDSESGRPPKRTSESSQTFASVKRLTWYRSTRLRRVQSEPARGLRPGCRGQSARWLFKFKSQATGNAGQSPKSGGVCSGLACGIPRPGAQTQSQGLGLLPRTTRLRVAEVALVTDPYDRDRQQPPETSTRTHNLSLSTPCPRDVASFVVSECTMWGPRTHVQVVGSLSAAAAHARVSTLLRVDHTRPPPL